MSQHSYTKSKRLLTPSAFQGVFDKALYRVSHKNFLLLARPNLFDGARLGLVIGKKNIRLAVNRNLVKRMVRESFRLEYHRLPAVDVIFLARRNLDQVSKTDITNMLMQSWAQLISHAQKT